MTWIFVDVEANGKSPASGVMTEFGAVEYKTRLTFHGIIWESKPDPENPARSLPTVTRVAEDRDVIEDFDEWVQDVCGRSRPVFVSDNPAYDWQWINYYFDKTLGRNPFGHSGRRISDFYAGLTGNFSNTQEWKQWRITPHDHNPVNDAMGNVEAFERILQLASSG